VKRRLRILLFMSAVPYPPTWGAGIRNYEVLRQLARNHDVTVLTYGASDQRDATRVLEQICARVVTVAGPPLRMIPAKRRRQMASLLSSSSYRATWLHSRELQDALDRLLDEGDFDVIQIESSMMSRFKIERGRAIVVLDEHNIEYEAMWRSFRTERSPIRKAYYLAEYIKCRPEEIGAWIAADGCTVTSAREERIVRATIPDKPTKVVPNAVDTSFFRSSGLAPDPNELVFTGTMSYRPNVDAVNYFVRSVLPHLRRIRPSVHLTVVGADPPPELIRLSSPYITITGAVTDVRPFFERASVAVVPIRMGSGTRLKIGEALAMAKPIVSTTLGAEGIDLQDGQHILLADDPVTFAAQVVRALGDPVLTASLGARGRAFAEEHLSWAESVARLEQFHAELLAKADARRQVSDRSESAVALAEGPGRR
jgi:sugar transferase (PEP-CTERM/EpsH1 system associated)